MFDVGFGELVLLFVIGLLVLGPQRLPKVAAELGKWIGRARRTATDLRRQLEREIELSEITRPPPPPAQPPEAEPAPAPPDPYTPEAQHGHEETPSSANGGAPESAGAEPPATAATEPAPEPAAAETPSQSQDPVHSPPPH